MAILSTKKKKSLLSILLSAEQIKSITICFHSMCCILQSERCPFGLIFVLFQVIKISRIVQKGSREGRCRQEPHFLTVFRSLEPYLAVQGLNSHALPYSPLRVQEQLQVHLPEISSWASSVGSHLVQLLCLHHPQTPTMKDICLFFSK